MKNNTVAENRRARYEFDIVEQLEAGLALTGDEVKSIRAGDASITEAFGRIENNEAQLYGMHIARYNAMSSQHYEATRPRKLLLHRQEIYRLWGQTRQAGCTIVPLRLYFKRGWAKVELAIARGRKRHDKRRAIAERETERTIRRRLQEH